MKQVLTVCLLSSLLASCSDESPLLLTLVGTNDVHGQLLQKDNQGGLGLFSAYVNAIRNTRANDGGAVLLIDAGDMWQGTLESNLSEGASVVAAFNALGYTAAAVGNHEFDFGPTGPAPIPEADTDDARGALKQRALEAEFPFLAANLIDDATGLPVNWENVRPSVVIDVQNIKVGIIGVMTRGGLAATIAANTRGLSIAPLVETIKREATAMRGAGATIVIVTAHAGGQCLEFDDPNDTSSCGPEHEIFGVAESLPEGLVNHIFAGHTHQGIAHFVNGISITSSFSRTMAFSRVDMTIDRKTGALVNSRVFAPTPLQPIASYEGVALTPNPTVTEIVNRASDIATDIKREKIGITLETPFTLDNNPESALGLLFTDSMLDSADADITIHAVSGGIRANLPAGELTYGNVYEMMPFDNTLVVLELTGAELRRVMAEQAHRSGHRVAFSGMTVEIACAATSMTVDMRLADGHNIDDGDALRVGVANYLALGGDGILRTVMPAGGYDLSGDEPLLRDAIIGALKARGGSIEAGDFLNDKLPGWTLPSDLNPGCRLNP